MAKVIFIVQRKRGTTHEQCMADWAGERHTSVVSGLPGLTRWVQNHVQPAPDEPPACDGVGELWFESDEAMQQALGSTEMAAAVEDAHDFLDMEATALVIVDEKVVIDQLAAA